MEKDLISEKEYYRQKIIEMVGEIENAEILNYIYIIVSDVAKEVRKEEKGENSGGTK